MYTVMWSYVTLADFYWFWRPYLIFFCVFTKLIKVSRLTLNGFGIGTFKLTRIYQNKTLNEDWNMYTIL